MYFRAFESYSVLYNSIVELGSIINISAIIKFGKCLLGRRQKSGLFK